MGVSSVNECKRMASYIVDFTSLNRWKQQFTDSPPDVTVSILKQQLYQLAHTGIDINIAHQNCWPDTTPENICKHLPPAPGECQASQSYLQCYCHKYFDQRLQCDILSDMLPKYEGLYNTLWEEFISPDVDLTLAQIDVTKNSSPDVLMKYTLVSLYYQITELSLLLN